MIFTTLFLQILFSPILAALQVTHGLECFQFCNRGRFLFHFVPCLMKCVYLPQGHPCELFIAVKSGPKLIISAFSNLSWSSVLSGSLLRVRGFAKLKNQCFCFLVLKKQFTCLAHHFWSAHFCNHNLQS